MKKILSLVLSVMMIFAVGVGSTTIALAATTVKSPSHTDITRPVKVEVNGNSSKDVTYDVDKKNPNKFKFSYDGDGKLIGWEFPGMIEGVDYDIISEDGNTITILVHDSYTGTVTANAIVEKDETTTKKPNQNGNPTSPETGVFAATGLGVAGAGAAILVALKKKNDAE